MATEQKINSTTSRKPLPRMLTSTPSPGVKVLESAFDLQFKSPPPVVNLNAANQILAYLLIPDLRYNIRRNGRIPNKGFYNIAYNTCFMWPSQIYDNSIDELLCHTHEAMHGYHFTEWIDPKLIRQFSRYQKTPPAKSYDFAMSYVLHKFNIEGIAEWAAKVATHEIGFHSGCNTFGRPWPNETMPNDSQVRFRLAVGAVAKGFLKTDNQTRDRAILKANSLLREVIYDQGPVFFRTAADHLNLAGLNEKDALLAVLARQPRDYTELKYPKKYAESLLTE